MMAWTLTGRESALSILGRKLRRLNVARVRMFALVLFRMLLVLGACALFTVAAWGVVWELGCVVAAMSCLFLEWLVKR
jgi:energy-converting hydrogenase Eha subunit C